MIDRKKGPIITTEFDLSVHSVEQSSLSNGIELIEINDGTQDIVKVDFVFRTGRIHETDKASAKAAISLLREGSTRHNAEELAEIYDFYGAVVKTTCTMEYVAISLVVVERYFQKVWPIWLHMIFYPLYDDEEIRKYNQVNSQKLTEQLAKNDIQSYRKLTEVIFGTNHPYGYNTEPSDVSKLNRRMLLDFYNQNMGVDDSFVIVAGKYSTLTRNTLIDSLAVLNRKSVHPTPAFYDNGASPDVQRLSTSNNLQTSIKLGRLLFPIKHPDYNSTKILDMVLGGYFGSRLMKNIREEKGYTYGIYSSVHCWNHGGFVYISADVDNSYIEPTLEEIKSEMARLRRVPIPEAELELVRNYILGQSLHLLDGPFAKAELVKSLKVKHKSLDDFSSNISQLKKISSSELLAAAQKYLNPKDYTVILAGQFAQ